MPKTVSEYNAARDFGINFQESRLHKAAAIIHHLNPGKMLDIGCSTGEWGAIWKQNGWNVFGVDISAKAVKAAQAKGVTACTCDINQHALPYAPETFNFIFAGEVIEHLIDTDFFISELARTLVPGGHVLLTTPNLASFENRIRLLLGKYPRWLDYRLTDCGHVRGYTPEVLQKQLNTHGFSIKKKLGNWVPFLPQSWMDDVRHPWLSFTGSLWPSLSMDILVLAQKSK
jgi:2-polyprenyl-3-methyl-5-hydroxy-6-metoxy-1,4-benzoquinol methylase